MGTFPGLQPRIPSRFLAKTMDGMDGMDPDEVPPAIPPQPHNPKPETRNPKPETRNLKPETRNPKRETRNPKRET